MALPFPEGQVYFRRSALNLKNPPYNFDAQDTTSFYSHFLLENVWNTWAFSSHTNPTIDNIPTHPRSKPVKGYASGYGTHFGKLHSSTIICTLVSSNHPAGVWDKTTVMFSDDQSGKSYSSTVELTNNQNFNELRNRDQGGPLKTILRPVPIKTDKRFMLIDWVNPFRAVYFPIAHQAGKGYEDLCIYLMIDFRLRQGVTINSPLYQHTVDMKFDRELGLTYRHTDVMSFDLKGIYNYLMLPQQLRNPDKDLYSPKNPKDSLITLWNCHQQTFQIVGSQTLGFLREIDLVSVINDNYGVDVTWQPYEYSSWVVDFLTHVTGLALGFIPVIGPMLSVSFSIGLQAIVDPDSFKGENILNLSADVIAGLIGTGMEVRGNLPESHQTSGAKLLVIRGTSAKPSGEKATDGEKGITELKSEDGENQDQEKQDVEKEDRGAKVGDEGK